MEICSPNSAVTPWNRDCSDSYTIKQRLSDFSMWRGKETSDTNGLWHLMTKCYTTPAVGIAWLKTLCVTKANPQITEGVLEHVTGAAVSAIVPLEWKVMVHEMGHNFGSEHDCITSTCPCVDRKSVV